MKAFISPYNGSIVYLISIDIRVITWDKTKLRQRQKRFFVFLSLSIDRVVIPEISLGNFRKIAGTILQEFF